MICLWSEWMTGKYSRFNGFFQSVILIPKAIERSEKSIQAMDTSGIQVCIVFHLLECFPSSQILASIFLKACTSKFGFHLLKPFFLFYMKKMKSFQSHLQNLFSFLHIWLVAMVEQESSDWRDHREWRTPWISSRIVWYSRCHRILQTNWIFLKDTMAFSV